MLGVHCSSGFSLAAASRSCSCCSVWASHAVEHGLWGMGASVLGTTRLWSTGSIVVAHTGSTKLWHLVAPQHMGSSQIRDRTHVSYIGGCFIYHRAIREAPDIISWMSMSIDGSLWVYWGRNMKPRQRFLVNEKEESQPGLEIRLQGRR